MPFVVQNGKGTTPRLSRARLLVVEVDLHANLHCPSETHWVIVNLACHSQDASWGA